MKPTKCFGRPRSSVPAQPRTRPKAAKESRRAVHHHPVAHFPDHRLLRDFLFSMSDLFRMRVTSATDTLQEYQSNNDAALLKLMATDVEIGCEWFASVATGGSGGNFYLRWQRKIKKAVTLARVRQGVRRRPSEQALQLAPRRVIRGILRRREVQEARTGEARFPGGWTIQAALVRTAAQSSLSSDRPGDGRIPLPGGGPEAVSMP